MTSPNSDFRWQVTSQTQGFEPGPNNQMSRGWTVYFRTDHGTTGSVFVPVDQYTPDRVKQMIEDQYQLVDQVHSLKG